MEHVAGDRAISQIIGAVMVAVILLGLFTMFQVYGVPAENEKIEFRHSQSVRGDMLEVRNAFLDAKRSGETTTATVRLAPSYPTRLFALNPPPATGTLATGENGTVTVLREGVTPVEVCPVDPVTRPFTYEAQYNVYDEAPTMRFENTVTYADFGDATRPISGQQLVQGDRVDLLLVQNAYSETGSGVASVEPRPGQLRERNVVDPTITVPTALDESTWEEYLDGEVAPADVAVSGGELTLDLTGVYTVSCGVVGARGVPPGGQRSTAGGSDVNPAGPGNLELVGAEILPKQGGGPGGGGGGGNSEDVRITFQSSASEQINVTEARIAFYYQAPNPSRAEITEAILYDSPTPGTDERATLVIQDPSVELSQPIAFAPGDQRQISMRFDVRPDQNDFYVLQFTFEDGQKGTYFVGMD